MTDLSGQSLGRYQILDRLGEGSMATVYKVYDTRMECYVAVKGLQDSPTLKQFIRDNPAQFQEEYHNQGVVIWKYRD